MDTFPESELFDPKNEEEIIELWADFITNTLNFMLTIGFLYWIYNTYEHHKVEVEISTKNIPNLLHFLAF